MMLSSILLRAGLASGQLDQLKWLMDDGLVWGLVFSLFLLLGPTLLVALYKKRQSSGGSGAGGLNINTNFLDNLQTKGGLNPDEIRMVRETMVRRALEKEEAQRRPATTLQDLALSVHGGVSPQAAPRAQTAQDRQKDAASARSAAPEAASPISPPSPRAQEKSIETFASEPSLFQDKPHPTVPAPEIPPWEIEGDAPWDDATEPQRKATTPEKPSGSGIDVESLYAQGLIGREEYEKLLALARRAAQGR